MDFSSRPAGNLANLIGQTPLLRVPSLSQITQCDIFVKCEFQNPGGSVKDRAALQMVLEAERLGQLKPGMTIVEGTAGNTGIGLAVVAKSRGYKLIVVMPKGQAKEKEQLIELYGGQLKLVDAVPFTNENHFYHTARRIAQQDCNYWWADQFENEANSRAHYLNTGPEIYKQCNRKLDCFLSVAGTGGTLGGISKYLKEANEAIHTVSVDPDGSGIFEYLTKGSHVATAGSSFTEGIGIMRLVKNFAQSKIDSAINLPDQDIVTIANYVREHDALVLGSSSALNVAAAFYWAIKNGPMAGGKKRRIATIACDSGERSVSKLYNQDFLISKGIAPPSQSMTDLVARYHAQPNRLVQVNYNL